MKKLTILIFLLLIPIISFSQEKEVIPEPSKKEENKPPVSPVLPPKSGTDELNAQEIFEMNKNALVSIWYIADGYYSYYSYIPKDTMLLNGSGFIIYEEGIIGTNVHVIENKDSLLVKTFDGTFYNAEIIFTDPKNDIAILKIINPNGMKYPTIKIGDSDSVKIGQSIYAIGSPLGFEYTISEGIIAGLRTNEKVSFSDYEIGLVEKVFDKVIQITAAISPGNSGGALFNGHGEVIGITTYSYGFYGNLNFAVGINTLSKYLSEINFADNELTPELITKREDELFNRSYRNAINYKYRVIDNWFYTKQKDTMKTYDTLIVKQDSINKANFIKSESLFEKCLNLRPDTFYVYRDLLDLYIFTDNYKKAEDLYLGIREKFTSDSLLNTLSSSLASAYSSSKDYKKALSFYDKMLKADTSDYFIYYQIANTYEMMKDYETAIKKYNLLLKKDSSYTKAYIAIGKIYYANINDYEEASKYFNLALERSLKSDYGYGYYGTEYVDLFYYLGMTAIKEKKKTLALLYYLELKNIYSYSDEERNKKLELYKAIKKLEE